MSSRSYRSLTPDEVSSVVTYNALTGALHWLLDGANHMAGDVAGRKAAKGYLGLSINGAPVLCHRLIWFMAYGEWPAGDIDHINGRRQDNRLSNLRAVSRALNMQNLRAAHADSESQILGVYFDRRRGKWYSSIFAGGRNRFLGYFDSTDLASQAYVAAKRELHEACTL